MATAVLVNPKASRLRIVGDTVSVVIAILSIAGLPAVPICAPCHAQRTYVTVTCCPA